MLHVHFRLDQARVMPPMATLPRALASALLLAAVARAADPLPAKCQAAADAFCATSCYPNLKSRPCGGPMIAADAAGGPHGGGWKCYSPSCLSANHSTYVGGGCFCSDDTQIRAVLHKQPGCAAPAPAPPPIPFGFAKALGDGMVLAAAPKQAMVWGFCDAGASVDVSIDGGATVKAAIGPDQATGALTTWRLKLPATKASFANHTITASSGGKTATLSGVLFGEVWICSGQVRVCLRHHLHTLVMPVAKAACRRNGTYLNTFFYNEPGAPE